MLIRKQDLKTVDKKWGNEVWICNNDKYCGKILNLKRDIPGSAHFHKDKDETFFVLEGKVKLEYLEEDELKYLCNKDGRLLSKYQAYRIVNQLEQSMRTIVLYKGDSFRLRPCDLHRFRAIDDDAIVIEFSTPHFDEDTFRVIIS